MPSLVHQLSIESAFNGLSQQEKLYAHHISRAAWHGTRIILQQVSPESTGIFDLLIGIYTHYSGNWTELINECGESQEDLDSFFGYAATFLLNIGNYYGSGDQKLVPAVKPIFFHKIVASVPNLNRLYAEVAPATLATSPSSLGFPSEVSQSMYYAGTFKPTREEIPIVSKELERRSIYPEYTRMQKSVSAGDP